MSNLRFKVVESAFEKKATDVNIPAERPADYFGQLVFNREKMFKYLPEKIYNKLIDCIDNAMPLDRDTADGVAAGMKQWAMEMGCTHYTHWFSSAYRRYCREARCLYRAQRHAAV
jgi:glutamine synthetase